MGEDGADGADGAADGERVAGSQEYEVGFFAQKHGNMREKLDEEAEKLGK